MLSQRDILLKLKELKPLLSEEYAVNKIGLFGSFAEKTNTASSDIDVIVELDKPIGWKFLSLELYLGKIFNRKIDLVTKNALKDQIKDDILKHVIYA